MELKTIKWLSSLISIFLFFSYADASVNPLSSKKVLTIKTSQDTSLSALIKSSGYNLDDKDLENFLRDFISMNKNLKSLSTIPKGTHLKLPVKNLKVRERKTTRFQKVESGGSKKNPYLKLPRYDALILKNIEFLIDSLADGISMKSDGIKVFSVGSKSELSFDTSFFPLIETKDNTIIMLDYKGILSKEIKDIIEKNWPVYKVVSGYEEKDIKNIISLLLDSMGYDSYSDSKIILGGKPKIEIFADFVIMKKSDDIFKGNFIAINILKPKEYRSPDELIKWAKDRDIKIIELPVKEPPLHHKRVNVMFMPEEEAGKFYERFLALLGYKFRKGMNLKLSGRKEYEFNIKADLSVTSGNRTKIIDFSETSEQTISYAKRRGFDIININLNEKHSETIRQIIGLLMINYEDKPETTSSYLTPKGVKYRLTAPGIIINSKNRLFFLVDPEIDIEFLSTLVSESVTLIRY
jgi:hypothetical protein